MPKQDETKILYAFIDNKIKKNVASIGLNAVDLSIKWKTDKSNGLSIYNVIVAKHGVELSGKIDIGDMADLSKQHHLTILDEIKNSIDNTLKNATNSVDSGEIASKCTENDDNCAKSVRNNDHEGEYIDKIEEDKEWTNDQWCLCGAICGLIFFFPILHSIIF